MNTVVKLSSARWSFSRPVRYKPYSCDASSDGYRLVFALFLTHELDAERAFFNAGARYNRLDLISSLSRGRKVGTDATRFILLSTFLSSLSFIGWFYRLE